MNLIKRNSYFLACDRQGDESEVFSHPLEQGAIRIRR